MYVYFIRSESKPPMLKIGKANNPTNRLITLQTGSPHKLTLIGSIPCLSEVHALSVESRLHHQFRGRRRHGEWFRYNKTLQLILSSIVRNSHLPINEALNFARIETGAMRRRRNKIARRMQA